MNVVVLPMGDAALLAEVGSLDDVLGLHAALAASAPSGVVELVPAARTVLVRVDPAHLQLATARSWIERAAAGSDGGGLTGGEERDREDADAVALDVVYDGADLDETAALLGITPAALVDAHAGVEWQVAFTGFAPGFGYLVSHEWPYDVPRLASPRARVPAGAIGLAAGFSGAYPRETPGGWRLIGRTAATLFDPDAADAASSVLLPPGTRVRFRAVDAAPVPEPTSVSEPVQAPEPDPVPELVEGSSPAAQLRRLDKLGDREQNLGDREHNPGDQEPELSDHEHEAGSRSATLRILEPGLLATVQDLGRPGRAALGIARSGALDRAALRTANRLVGNAEDAAGIEIAMGGFRAVATADVWFAVTGAIGPLTLDGREVDQDVAHVLPGGAQLHADWFAHGARAYLAVRGGVGAHAAVGSRSTDTLAGIGPARLAAGDALDIGHGQEVPIPVTDLAPWGAPPDELEISLAPGPRASWFTSDALATLFDAVWTVSAQADRVGIRLDGPELVRTRRDELASEGMVPGALQVPPSGRPTILLADGPVTGGYPVIAVVADAALDLLAQARPGTRIRFRHAR
ncbi:urea amidolyase family protein [Microbacterium candidum]|uniref:Urea amidolyase family protein n=1 Tax=Microbacterium candidum TaxID=3041922 RepID=A0ABT7MXI1_9MICO|nr:urea amidolyase family protein [Microbacterium sp. ASV49]MDL9979167.1 urea amidolyase family protein [Microbacterium sp. ASV49]